MKKVLLFGALICSSVALSQSLTQANEPTIGEVQSMYLCDSFANQYPGVTGNGVTWDYSNLQGYSGITRDLSCLDATTAPNAADFPTSVKVLDIQGSITSYWNSTATERSSQGFVFSEPTFGDVVVSFSTDEQILVQYPFALGNSFSDPFAGTLEYDFGGPQSTPATGNAHASIDGQGTLELMSNTYTDVIRFHSVDTSTANITLLGGDVEIIRNIYEYYDIANQNLPVLLVANIVLQQVGGGAPLTEQTLVLSKDAPTEFVGLEDNAIDFSIYPNPTTDFVTIKGNFTEDATASIFDRSGRVIGVQEISNGGQVDLSALADGMYMLQISNNGTSTTKSIVKR